MQDLFADVIEANQRYAERFGLGGIAPQAARGLGVLTCIDSRIEPLAMLGLRPGDAKIFRNAGARVTEDGLRSLVLAANLLAVRRIMIVAHTDCAMARCTDDELRRDLAGRYPDADFSHFEPHAAPHQLETLAADVERVRSCGMLPDDVHVAGFVYNVHDGRLSRLDA